MILKHKTIAGKFIEIEPLSARDLQTFPKHSATLSVKQTGRKGADFTKLCISQQEAIQYAKVYGYSIPFGF